MHISLNEAERVRLGSSESLDAWSVYHVGLRHMYRFNRNDNAIAAQLLARATELNPGFARAFTQFQIAFLRYEADTTAAIENARRFAEKCVELDPFDPLGNFTYGRSHWPRGDPEAGQAWIERAVSLSPSFAQGIYAHGWADMIAGRGREAVQQYDTAIGLSPLDTYLYAMQSARGFARQALGEALSALGFAGKDPDIARRRRAGSDAGDGPSRDMDAGTRLK